jgi:hypothetical protein
VISSGQSSSTTWKLQGSGRVSEGDAGIAGSDDVGRVAFAGGTGSGEDTFSSGCTAGVDVTDGTGIETFSLGSKGCRRHSRCWSLH